MEFTDDCWHYITDALPNYIGASSSNFNMFTIGFRSGLVVVTSLTTLHWVIEKATLLKYFLPFVYFEGNLDSGNKFNNMTTWWRHIASLCQSSNAEKLKMMSTLLCVILVAARWAVFKLQRGVFRAPPPPSGPVPGPFSWPNSCRARNKKQ